eukprot:5956081-Prymnesium_polylepis.1
MAQSATARIQIGVAWQRRSTCATGSARATIRCITEGKIDVAFASAAGHVRRSFVGVPGGLLCPCPRLGLRRANWSSDAFSGALSSATTS